MIHWNHEPHYIWWQRMMDPPPPTPPPVPEVTAWDVEKSANRLQRMTERVERGRWQPTLPFRLNGQARRELREAYALLASVPPVLEASRMQRGT